MLDSISQWNLLADCARDWGFSSDEGSHGTAEDAFCKTECFSAENKEKHYSEPMQKNSEFDLAQECCEPLDLIHYAALSADEEKTLLHELMANPKNATLWQLCLMGYSRENIGSIGESMENPLDGVEAWLLQGIRKGWLRKQKKQYAVTYLDYPLFIHRLQQDCRHAAVCTVAVVKIQVSDLVHELVMQSLSEFLQKEDYVCRMSGIGYAVVLGGRKNFAASAVMEKVSMALEQFLHKEDIGLQFSVGLAEFCQFDDADILLDHAKQALSLPSPAGIKVKSFINQKKNLEKDSLVHSDEKRFLFFGVQ